MTTITAEERARLRYIYGSEPIPNVLRGFACFYLMRILNALEAAEARAEKAEREKTVLLEKIMVIGCPYESCARDRPEHIEGCDNCWSEWAARQATSGGEG